MIYPVIFSFLLAVGGALLISHLGGLLGLTDHPNVRSSHTRATPRGGGIGILAAFFLSSVHLELPLGFILGVAGISIISLLDDWTGLPSALRLILQFLLAGAALVSMPPGFSDVSLQYLPVLVIIVGTANFYNFMDGINGIAGFTGLIAFGLLAIFTHIAQGPISLVAFTLCISAACAGFLPFNIPKARVFMGDVGSILIGLLFSILAAHIAKDIKEFVLLSSFLLPFYVDELTTMFIRIRLGENLFKAHRRHFYQFLANECRLPHWRISAAYGTLQGIIGLGAIYLHDLRLAHSVVYFSCFFLILTIGRFTFESRRRKIDCTFNG
jgi:Fuc2NAc and GlcNAc transferase